MRSDSSSGVSARWRQAIFCGPSSALDALLGDPACLAPKGWLDTPLGLCAEAGEKKMAAKLLAAGADPSCKDAKGTSALVKAVEAGRPEMVELLLAAGADPCAQDASGNSPLMLACESGCSRSARALLGAGADPSARDKHGVSAAELAVAGQGARSKGASLQLLSLLFDSGLDPRARDPDFGSCMVCFCADWGGLAEMELALERGGDPLSCDARGRSALALACQEGRLSCARTLIGRGASIEHPDETGCRPLSLACENGWADVARMLLCAGADMEARDCEGLTPILIAARAGQAGSMSLLRAAGADWKALCHAGKGVVEWASSSMGFPGGLELGREARLLASSWIEQDQLSGEIGASGSASGRGRL